MKLWDWDKGWECARTFRSGGIDVDHIAFDPKETKRFVATDCLDGKVTVWDFNSLLKKQ
jgi:coatomer subunit beta'